MISTYYGKNSFTMFHEKTMKSYLFCSLELAMTDLAQRYMEGDALTKKERSQREAAEVRPYFFYLKTT